MELIDAADATPFLERDRVDTDLNVLVGSRCERCGACSWPGRAVCSRCGSAAVGQAPLPPTGALTSYTTVHVARPGLEAPYVLGQVDLGDGAMVFAHVRGLTACAVVPLPVRTVLDEDPAAVPRFWFEPSA